MKTRKILHPALLGAILTLAGVGMAWQAGDWSWLLFLGGILAGTGLVLLVGPAIDARRQVKLMQQKLDAMERLNRETQALAHHQRLEMLGTLTSSIAHEFNNLLTPIMGYSLMALEKLPPEEELYENLLEIYNASRQAKTIISRLSDLTRKNAPFHMVAPDEVVQKALEVAAPAKPKNVELRRNLNCWDQRILASEIQLSQLLLNLILNGFHAMEPDGGELTVDTSFDDGSLYIRVSDAGRGIPPEIRGKIFEPFFTTKDTGKGTGLGLAIAAQIVEDHKGTIKVDSTEGKGTVVTVILPRK